MCCIAALRGWRPTPERHAPLLKLRASRYAGKRRSRTRGPLAVRRANSWEWDMLRLRYLLVSLLYLGAIWAGSAQAQAKLDNARLDQLLAPVALYPDSLLSQVLMAATYPDDVAAAAKWSADHPKDSGDAAVKAAEGQPWDQRQVPGGVSVGHGSDGAPAAMGQVAGRCLPGAARRRHGFRAAPARRSQEGRHADQQQAAESHHHRKRRQDRRGGRAGRSAGGLRSQLQPHRGVRRLAVSGLSALLLSAAARLGLRDRPGRRHRLRPGRGGGRRHVGRLRLGTQ